MSIKMITSKYEFKLLTYFCSWRWNKTVLALLCILVHCTLLTYSSDEVSRLSCRPIANLTRCNTEFEEHPKWIWRRHVEYLIIADIKKSCPSSQLIIQWKIQNQDGSGLRLLPEFQNKPQFLLRNFYLGTGSYVLNVTAIEDAGVTNYETNASCLITIREEDPIPCIVGGIYRKVPTNVNFFLQGNTSINMNEPPWVEAQLNYRWTCTATPPNEFCPINHQWSNLYVPAKFAINSTTYNFVVNVSANGITWFSTQQTVQIRSWTREITINCVKNCLFNIDLTNFIYFEAKCLTCSDFHTNISWSFEADAGNVKQTFDFSSESMYGIKSNELIIRANVLKPKDKYRFRLKYNDGLGESAVAITSDIPTGGPCEVDPTSGESIKTKFIVKCAYDPKIPIVYKLFDKDLGAQLGVSYDGVFNYTYLSNKHLKVQFFNYDGVLCNELEMEVSLTGPTNDIKNLKEIYEGKAEPFEPVELLLFKGDIEKAIQLIVGLARAMKNSEEKDAVLELQWMFLKDLRSIELNSMEVIQLVANIIKTIQVQFDRSFMKELNEFTKNVALSYVTKVTKVSWPRERQNLTEEAAINLTSAAFMFYKEQQEDLQRDLYPIILPTSGPLLDIPAITENFPNYDDADLLYLTKLSDYENITNNKVETARFLNTAIGFTMAPGQPTSKYGEQEVYVDYGRVLAWNLIPIKNKQFAAHSAAYAYKDDIVFIMITRLDESYYWWKNDMIRSPQDAFNADLFVPNYGIYNFPRPMKLFFPFQTFSSNKTSHSITVPHSGTLLPQEIDYYMKVHRVDVDQGTGLVLTFDLNETVILEVIVVYNRRPTYLDFENPHTVNKTMNKVTSAFPISMIKFGKAWAYVGILPAPTIKRASSLDEKTVDYKLSIKSPTCFWWDPNQNNWSSSTCRTDEDDKTNRIGCSCFNSGAFSYVLNNATFVTEERVHVQFTTHVDPTCVIPVFVFVVFTIYCLALCFAANKINRYNKNVFWLCDNLMDDLYAYLIIVKTGHASSAGTTSNVGIKLFGTKRRCKAHIINYPDPEMRLLQRGSQDWFLLSTPRHLGDLTHIYLWHDSIGISSSWFCDWITVKDMQIDDQEWYFSVHHSFDVLQGQEHYIQVNAWTEEAHSSDGMEFFKYFKHHHSWNIWKAYNINDLSYLEEVTLVFSTILATLFFVICFSDVPAPEYYGYGACYYEISLNTFTIACLSSVVSFTLHVILTILFRLCRRIDRRGIILLPWLLVTVKILSILTYLIIFGPWIPYYNGLIILTCCLGALILSITLLEGVYCFFMFYRECQNKTPKVEPNVQNIVKESTKQRIHLYSTFGENLLQGYVAIKYRPQTKEEWKVKRQKEFNRVKLAQYFHDMVMFFIYLIVLFFIVFANRDSLNIYSNSEMKDLVYGLHTRTEHFEDINTISEFYLFLNTTIIPVTHPVNWYGTYNLEDPGNMADYNTKILGVVRVRQLRVNCCSMPSQAALLNLSCWPEFYANVSDRGSYAEDWKPNQIIAVPRLGDSWNYLQEAAPTLGYMTVYPGGGFSARLGRTHYNSLYNLRYLKQTNWIDEHTRALFIEFLAYNANYNIFHAVKLTVEISASGLFAKSSIVFTTRMLFVNSENKVMILVAFAVFLTMVFMMFYQHVYGISLTLHSYVRNVWNYVDWFIIILSIVCTWCYAYRSTLVEEFLNELIEANHNEIVSYYHLIFFEEFLMVVAAILICVSILRLWKCLRFGKVFQIMERTLVLAAAPLMTVFLLHLILLVVYTLTGYLMFGSRVYYFRSLTNAFASMILLAISLHSHFNVAHLEEGFYGFGYFYYITFSLITLVMITLYIAVITLSYHQSRDDYSCHSSYTISQYLKDVCHYRKDFIQAKLNALRLKGGGKNTRPKATSKADKIRYANPVDVPEFKLRAMSVIAQSILRNKYTSKTNEMTDYKMNLMRKTVLNMFSKDKIPQPEDPSDIAFIWKEKDENGNVKLVRDDRLLDMEFVVNYVLNKGSEEDSKKKYFDKVKQTKVVVVDRRKINGRDEESGQMDRNEVESSETDQVQSTEDEDESSDEMDGYEEESSEMEQLRHIAKRFKSLVKMVDEINITEIKK